MDTPFCFRPTQKVAQIMDLAILCSMILFTKLITTTTGLHESGNSVKKDAVAQKFFDGSKNETEHLQKQNKQISDQLQSSIKEKENLTTQNKALSDQLQHSKQEKENLTIQNNALFAQLTNAKTEREELENQNKALTNQMLILKSQNERIQNENNHLNNQVQNLTTENDNLLRYVVEYIEAMKKVKIDASEAKKSIQLVSIEMARLRSVEVQLKQDLKVLRNETEHLRKENEMLKNENHAYI